MQDQVDDSNPTYLFKAAEEMELPEWFTSAPELTSESVSKLPPLSFADQPNRLFPVHTKEACLDSAICFYGKRYNAPAIESNIKRAAAAHGIMPLVEKVIVVFTPTVKRASAPEPRYALAIADDVDGGATRYFYPIDGESDLTKSARNLTKAATQERLPIPFVRTAAQEMVKRCYELKLDPKMTLPQEVLRMGEDRIPDFANALAAIEKRAEFCNVDEEGMRIYRDTVEAAKEAFQQDEDLQDFIDVISLVDETNQVKYSALIKDPYQVFFSGPTRQEVEKFAKEVVFVGDTPVPTEVFGSLLDTDIEGMFRGATATPIKQARDMAIGDAAGASQAIASIGEENEHALLSLMLRKAA